ncbi:hypothetical protein Tco_1406257 [Tanacetum coccineum]
MSNFMASKDARLSKFEVDLKQQQSEMTNKIDTVLKAITDRMTGALSSDTVKNLKLNVNSTSLVSSARFYPTEDPQCSTHIPSLINAIMISPKQPKKSCDDKLNSFLESSGLVPRSSDIKFVCTKEDDRDVMFIEIIKKYDDSREEELRENENATIGGPEVEYSDTFLTRSELAYHKYLMCGPIPSLFLRNPIIIEGCPSNLKIPCNIGHVHVEKAYIDLNSPLNIMTRMLYNWIMRRKLDPREDTNRGVSNFIGRIKGMHIFIGNFTYVANFVIVEDFRVVKFTDGINEIAYKMPHKIEQYNSLSNLEKEHTKLVYLRNEEDKRRGVEYVMSKILKFYKEYLELGPEYLTGVADEGGVT